MTYEKPEVEVVKFENTGFMTASYDWSDATSVLSHNCGGFSGATNNFSCSSFGEYGPNNPPDKHTSTVTLNNGQYTYVYDYVGNHWKLLK